MRTGTELATQMYRCRDGPCTVNRPCAVVLTCLAALVLALSGLACSPPEAPVSASNSCAPSPKAGVEIASEGLRVLRFSGDLAAPVDVVAGSGTKGEWWAVRTGAPPPLLQMNADRMGSDDHLTFELETAGTTVPPIKWPDGTTGYLYFTRDGNPVFSIVGCWRIWPVNGDPASGVVTEVR